MGRIDTSKLTGAKPHSDNRGRRGGPGINTASNNPYAEIKGFNTHCNEDCNGGTFTNDDGDPTCTKCGKAKQ